MHQDIKLFHRLGIFAGSLAAVLLVACGTTAASIPTAQPSPAGTVAESIAEPVASATVVPAPTETPEPTATALPDSTATPAPTAAPPASATPLPTTTPSVEDLERIEALGRDTLEFLTTLTEEFSPRESGTDQEKVAAEFLASRFEELGYDVSFQPFEVEIISRDSPSLSLHSPEETDFDGVPMSLTGTGSFSGEIAFIGKAFEEDLPPEGLDGKIALIERGEITFEIKSQRAADAGAVGVVVFNNQSGLFRGTLSSQADIPVVGVARETGEDILSLLEQGTVEATLSVIIEAKQSRNVIAEKPGTDANSGVVVLGGHFDTVADVPGVNDNGSGIAAIMTVAREIKDRSYPFTIRLIAFGSEELGLRGSGHYVNSLGPVDREATIAMLNFDALGTGPTPGVISDMEQIDELLEKASARGIQVVRRFRLTGGSSDHARFQSAGIPITFFMADDFSRIHTPQDTLEFVKAELLGSAAILGIDLLDILADG